LSTRPQSANRWARVPAAPPHRRFDTTNATLAALGLGALCGLFFGEATAPLTIVADAFIRLLQMAVLPYIVVSLTAAIGRLTGREARFIARTGGAVLLALWSLTLVLVVAMPLAFPEQQGRFFSSSAVETPEGFDLLGLYIPANPFRSLSDNVVPAVVLFCLAIGTALMGVPGREPLIAVLDVMTKALTRVNDFIARLMPLGVFAIAASSAGTLGFEEMGRIQAYLVSYVALACLATFWLLPGFIALVTPVRRGELLRAAREPLVAAFSTGSLLLVLPQLTRVSRDLVVRTDVEAADAETAVDVLVPVSFNFPHAGKVLTLGFVVFAAWFARTPLSAGNLLELATVGLLATFGSMNVALPFLLDGFGVPADLFQLFLAVGVLSFRFQTLLAAMHTLAVTIVGACAMHGRTRFAWRPAVRWAAGGVLALAATLAATRLFLALTLPPDVAHRQALLERGILAEPVDATVLRDGDALPAPPPGAGLERVLATGTLRVGYDPDRYPFSYINGRGELAGFDVDLMHRLARELGVRLVLVPAERPQLAAALDARTIDLAIGGLEVTTGLSREVALTQPYTTLTMAFVVADHRRAEFATRQAVQAQGRLRIGIVADDYYEAKLRAYLPSAEVVRLRSEREFFEGRGLGLDALADSAEIGGAWTLLYPDYAVVVPRPDRLDAPVAFAVPRTDNELRVLLNTWILLKREDQTMARLRRYWILGRDDGPRPPRWSILRDVLHWAP
jgi:Na+/H+-dicarboxylate symporter/ABC-type amino acid transport substrate-binding protein